MTESILDRDAAEVVAEAIRSLSSQTRDAAARLSNSEDVEALHDFRVSLRRLRTTLRDFRSCLGKVASRKLRRRLRGIQRESGASRDAEVQLAWLESVREAFTVGEIAGLEWFVEDLQRRAVGALNFRQKFARADRALSRRLTRQDPPTARATYAVVVAGLARLHAAELAWRIEHVRSIEDVEMAHRARIAGKRLRYLLEPLKEIVPEARSLVERLRALQDVLGEANDQAVLRARLAERYEESRPKAKKARQIEPGLNRIVSLSRARHEALIASVVDGWRTRDIPALVAQVDSFAAQLERRS